MRTAYEPCSRCRGYGMVDGLYGVRDCPICGGDCYVRARDARGRFTTFEVRHQADDDSSPSTPGEQLPGPVGEPTGPGTQTTPERFTRQPGQHLPPGLWQSDWSEPTQSEVTER